MLSQNRAVGWISQRKFDEGLEVAFEVSDVVPLLVPGKSDADDASPFLEKKADGVRQLYLTAFIKWSPANSVEDLRREDIASGDRKVARCFSRRWLLDEIGYFEDCVIGPWLDDSIVRRLLDRHLLDRNRAGCLPRFECRNERLDDVRWFVATDDRIAQRHHKRSISSEVLGAQDGISKATLTTLASVEEVDTHSLILEFIEQIFLTSFTKEPNELWIVVEMILN